MRSKRPKIEKCLKAAIDVIAALEADKKADPLPAIKAIAAIKDPVYLEMLVRDMVALEIPGVDREFVCKQVAIHCEAGREYMKEWLMKWEPKGRVQ